MMRDYNLMRNMLVFIGCSDGELNAYWKKVMPQYGYEYVTRKRSYKYNR